MAHPRERNYILDAIIFVGFATLCLAKISYDLYVWSWTEETALLFVIAIVGLISAGVGINAAVEMEREKRKRG